MAYRHGKHLVICDQCGFKKYNTECRMQWDNLFVCSSCYDPRHPQLDIRVKIEMSKENLRPEGTDTYLVDTSTWGAITDSEGNVLYDADGDPIMPASNQYGGS